MNRILQEIKERYKGVGAFARQLNDCPEKDVIYLLAIAEYLQDECDDLRDRIERLKDVANVSEIPCARCGGPCVEFVVPNVVWNEVVRRGGPEGDDEYICEACYRRCVNKYVLIQMSGKNSFRAAVRGKP